MSFNKRSITFFSKPSHEWIRYHQGGKTFFGYLKQTQRLVKGITGKFCSIRCPKLPEHRHLFAKCAQSRQPHHRCPRHRLAINAWGNSYCCHLSMLSFNSFSTCISNENHLSKYIGASWRDPCLPLLFACCDMSRIYLGQEPPIAH